MYIIFNVEQGKDIFLIGSSRTLYVYEDSPKKALFDRAVRKENEEDTLFSFSGNAHLCC